MSLITPDDAAQFKLPGISFTSLATPSRGSAETSVWQVEIDPGTPGTPHQLTREEVFVALSGTARVTIGNATFAFAAGEALVVPPETVFALANEGDSPFKALAIFPVGGKARIGDAAPITPPWAV